MLMRNSLKSISIIDGKEQKFIISRNKKDFSLIEKTGLSNLTTDYLTAMVKKYFML